MGAMGRIIALAGGACVAALCVPVQAQERIETFNIAGGDLNKVLAAYARRTGIQLIYRADELSGTFSPGAVGTMSADQALRALLDGTQCTSVRDRSGAIAIRRGRVHKTLAISAPAQALPASRPESEASAAQAPAAAPENAPEDIVVTAQKRDERLEDVPISITQVSGENLRKSGVVGLTGLAAVTPGINITRTGPYIIPGIRGISSQGTGILAENNVAIYVDGFYIPNQAGLNFDFNDVDQVQILKGPQGTLFGRNATGGAILVSTRDPSLDKPVVDAQLSYARFNDIVANSYMSMPLGTKGAFSVTGYFRNTDGYVTDARFGDDVARVRNRSVKAKLLVEPVEGLRLIAAFSYDRTSDPNGNTWQVYDSTTAPLAAPGTLVESRPRHSSLSFPAFNVNDVYAASLKVQADVADGIALTSLTRFGWQNDDIGYDIDGSVADLSGVFLKQKQEDFSQEVDLNMTLGRLDAVVGAFYFRNRASSPLIRSYSSAGTSIIRNDGHGEAVAVFADLSYHLTGRLTLTGGLRYNWEEKIFDNYRFNGAQFVNGAKVAYDDVTPRAVLRYEVGDRSNIYASYSQGFKSGTFNFNSPNTTPVRPEKIDAYEVGFKTVAGPLRLDMSAYYYDYRDLQVSAVVPGPGGIGRVTILTNAATAEIYGAELQAQLRVSSNFNLRAGVNYNHGRYKDFPNGPATTKDPVTGFNLLNQIQDFSGKQLVHSPDWTANLGGDYGIDLNNSGRLTVSGNLYYTSSYTNYNNSLRPDGSFRYLQRGYALLNGEIGWQSADGRYGVALFGRNLTNQRIKVINYGTAFGDVRTFAEPITYGVRLRFSMD